MPLTRWLTAMAVMLIAVLLTVPVARAVESVNVRLDAAAIDLTAATEVQHTEGDRIQVSTAPGPDGIVRRIEVRAREGNNNWAVFALTNNSDEQIDRLIGAADGKWQHYRGNTSVLRYELRRAIVFIGCPDHELRWRRLQLLQNLGEVSA